MQYAKRLHFRQKAKIIAWQKIFQLENIQFNQRSDYKNPSNDLLTYIENSRKIRMIKKENSDLFVIL